MTVWGDSWDAGMACTSLAPSLDTRGRRVPSQVFVMSRFVCSFAMILCDLHFGGWFLLGSGF